MALIYKQPVYAKLFKGNHIILFVCGKELFQSGFQRFSGFLHLLDCEILSTLIFQFFNRPFNLINLFPQLAFLPFCGQGNTFKLTVTDNNCIVIAGGNSGTEFLAVGCFKIFLCGNQQLCTGVQVQKLIRPL